jgi:hypothetical protein
MDVELLRHSKRGDGVRVEGRMIILCAGVSLGCHGSLDIYLKLLDYTESTCSIYFFDKRILPEHGVPAPSIRAECESRQYQTSSRNWRISSDTSSPPQDIDLECSIIGQPPLLSLSAVDFHNPTSFLGQIAWIYIFFRTHHSGLVWGHGMLRSALLAAFLDDWQSLAQRSGGLTSLPLQIDFG